MAMAVANHRSLTSPHLSTEASILSTHNCSNLGQQKVSCHHGHSPLKHTCRQGALPPNLSVPCAENVYEARHGSVALHRASTVGYGKGLAWKDFGKGPLVWSGKGRVYIPKSPTFVVAVSQASSWSASKSPYEILEVSLKASEEDVKAGYRRMVKRYHPDVYDGSEDEEGEKIDSKFISIQAAYELLIDPDERRKYDRDNIANPVEANREWLLWVAQKRRAWERRGDMAVSTWQEQQARDMSLRARNRSRLKMDPEEERRIIAKERAASVANMETTIKRHSLVMRKRELMRRKSSKDATKSLVQQMLEAEGFELLEDP